MMKEQKKTSTRLNLKRKPLVDCPLPLIEKNQQVAIAANERKARMSEIDYVLVANPMKRSEAERNGWTDEN